MNYSSDNSGRNLHFTVKRDTVQHFPQINQQSRSPFWGYFQVRWDLLGIGMLSTGKIDKFGNLHFLKIEPPALKFQKLNCEWDRTKPRLFSHFTTIDVAELKAYRDVVFMDPNYRDTLFMMHENSNRDNPRLARYTSMTRHQHLGTNITRDRTKRFIKNRPKRSYIPYKHLKISSITRTPSQFSRQSSKNALEDFHRETAWHGVSR